jgi:6-phosphogluconate dehydrogenase (decarboxylating)
MQHEFNLADFRSRHAHTFVEKLLLAMRQQFGGHVERQNDREDERTE